eukprot:scaffold3667_cov110-Isochrysis_galbana.AAC.9
MLAEVRNLVHLLGHRRRHNHDAVLVRDDGVAGADDDGVGLAHLDDALRLPRLHGGRALLGSRRVAEAREAVVENLVRVTHRAVRHQTADRQLLEPEEFDVTAD